MEPVVESATATANKSTSVIENGVTIIESTDEKAPGKRNPKLSVFREFCLATAHSYARKHSSQQSGLTTENNGDEDKTRQYFACDLIAQSGIAGLQWKRHIGKDIHVTLGEQSDAQHLLNNVTANSFTMLDLKLDPRHPAGKCLPPHQAVSELHRAQYDPTVLLQLEAFDFVFVDAQKNPVPYFSSLFRNMRNGGVACFVVTDTMQFARSPHVVRRRYGANCMKTEYLKELATRIILATLAEEAAKCNKGVRVLYAVSFEDCLLLSAQVIRGPKHADSVLCDVGHILHCRICEERAFYPDLIAPLENPYDIVPCQCQKNVPGKTGVVLGPVWKGRMYDYGCLSQLAASGKALDLSQAFFTLLQRVMEDCLCDTPPSLRSLQNGLADSSPPIQHSFASNGNETHTDFINTNKIPSDRCTNDSAVETCSGEESKNCHHRSNHSEKSQKNKSSSCTGNDISVVSKDTADSDVRVDSESSGVKRTASEAFVEEIALHNKRLKTNIAPAPCFFYNMHSKRLAKSHLPKHQEIVEILRSHGYLCCRTHFEKYAIRTNANLKTLTTLLGSGASKVLFVKGNQRTGM